MAQDYAKQFYNSSAWIKTAKAYASSVFFLCERCHKQGYIVHHKEHITPDNINNPDITLSWDNLMYLCTSCHNIIHSKHTDTRQPVFDDNGNMIDLIASPQSLS